MQITLTYSDDRKFYLKIIILQDGIFLMKSFMASRGNRRLGVYGAYCRSKNVALQSFEGIWVRVNIVKMYQQFCQKLLKNVERILYMENDPKHIFL